nr:hypothetical protein [Tanacetum cinerariifolium]
MEYGHYTPLKRAWCGEEVMKISNHFQESSQKLSSHMKNQDHCTSITSSKPIKPQSEWINLMHGEQSPKTLKFQQQKKQSNPCDAYKQSYNVKPKSTLENPLKITTDPRWDDYCLEELKMNRPVPCCPDARKALTQDEFKIPMRSECIARIDMKATWEAMEECQNLSLAKSIGDSNLSTKMIKEILSFAKIPPAVNQKNIQAKFIMVFLKIEMNPLWQQKNLTKFCKQNGILVTAYSPLGAVGNNAWGHNGVMECDVLQDISKSKGRTVAQNLEIFDWSLTEEELTKFLSAGKFVTFLSVVPCEKADDESQNRVNHEPRALTFYCFFLIKVI